MPRRTQIAALVTLALAPALWGCGSSDDAATGSPSGKGAESELPTLGKADSWAYANDHGTFPFGKQAWAEIDGLNRLHAWTFNVGDAGATVAAHTEDYADAFGPVDTVMYFYRRRADGGRHHPRPAARASRGAGRLACRDVQVKCRQLAAVDRLQADGGSRQVQALDVHSAGVN